MNNQSTPEKLRAMCDKLRRTNVPLADMIPLMQKAADELESMAQQDALVVPQGWKLVPLSPTPEMRKAAADAWIDCGDRLFLNKAAAALRAGIAAAPTPPSQQYQTEKF